MVWGLGWLLGNGKEKKEVKADTHEPEHNKSINNIHETIGTLEKREMALLKKSEEEEAKARKFLQENNRTAAANCIKKKKQYQTQIQRLQGQKQNLETTLLTLEDSVTNVETLKAQKQASDAIKKVYNGMKTEDIEDIMDDIRDTMDDVNQIGDALAQNVGPVFDEGELLDELEQLESDAHEEEMAKIKLPKEKVTKDKDTTLPVASKKQVDPEEAELEKELEALMN
ncbi:predicted protein [Naegleria gruberi]|uniref:Predicted protein n=1 Tax=Naegleria gruberi TaxID=5762 RepID=D2VWV9_NAEGR|nr:uncharacterized protein NAEGRDRAFT_81519 [Naegleria gruberi]EFC38695.1 predicted protein [Naegleria gruberi]|eukprot:XP_002671439.1 predicted protein [Naegleria gruberi strain NEG-M]